MNVTALFLNIARKITLSSTREEPQSLIEKIKIKRGIGIVPIKLGLSFTQGVLNQDLLFGPFRW